MHRSPTGGPSRALRLPVATVLAVALGTGGAALVTRPDRAEPVAELSAAPLVGAGGAALFSATALAPGRPVTRCVVITGSGAAGSVRLRADDVTGELARHLRFRVEVGTGGGRASCTGFTGGVAWTGPLTGLTGAPGVATGWETDGRPAARTYRITVWVGDADAMGLTSTATLRWLLVRTAGPAPSAAPGGTVAPAPAVYDDRGTWRDRLWHRIRRILDVALAVAAQSVRHAAIPLSALLIGVLFLIVQNRIDRRDPKLSLAPLSRDRYLGAGDHTDEVLTGEQES